jgi:membrane-bound metal-dependent hydrolase YbcI (DUF457 family)
MFILGHLGIGSRLVKPWTRGLRLRWVFLGTLLPDLIDKPLYYGGVWLTGRRGADLGLISGTRTFGHTALFLLGLTGVAVWKRSRFLAAVCFGVASHLFLDNLGDYFGARGHGIGTEYALLFPLLGAKFPVMPYDNLKQQLSSVIHPYILIGEVLGGLLLAWEYWKRKHRQEIFASLEERRWLRARRKRLHKTDQDIS